MSWLRLCRIAAELGDSFCELLNFWPAEHTRLQGIGMELATVDFRRDVDLVRLRWLKCRCWNSQAETLQPQKARNPNESPEPLGAAHSARLLQASPAAAESLLDRRCLGSTQRCCVGPRVWGLEFCCV